MSMIKPWKNCLQEYCQKHKLRLPNYRIKQEPSISNGTKFQVEVEVDGLSYIGKENCSSKKEAENSAAEKACIDLIGNNALSNVIEEHVPESEVDDNDSSKHFPPEYAGVEEFLVTLFGSFGGRIKKIKPPDTRGRYRLEIAGNYRYCENIERPHKQNRVYFLVDPINKVYYQKCYDPDCKGFQSAKQKIYTAQTVSKRLEEK